MGADGGEHHCRLHLRGRAPQRRQGTGGHSGVQRPCCQCVTDEEILAAQRLLGRTCGVFGEPAGVTGAAALKKACEQGLIEKDATVVSVVTGNGLKDVANAIKSAGEPHAHRAGSGPDGEELCSAGRHRGISCLMKQNSLLRARNVRSRLFFS